MEGVKKMPLYRGWTMMPPSIEQVASYTGAGAVFATLLGLVIRFLMKTFRTDRLEAATSGAEINTFQRLQSEITRLENIIKIQQSRTDELEDRMDKLKEIEFEGQADLAVLSLLATQFPCSNHCENPTEAFDQLRDVILRMNARKAERQGIIKEPFYHDEEPSPKKSKEKV